MHLIYQSVISLSKKIILPDQQDLDSQQDEQHANPTLKCVSSYRCKNAPYRQTQMDKFFNEAFRNIDNKLKLVKKSGTTACIVALKDSILHVMNLGDSQAVMSYDDQALYLTTKHNVENRKEVERVVKEGGSIKSGRLEGKLLVTRGLGDWEVKEKEKGLISEPEYLQFELKRGMEFIILGTDGLWDVMDGQEAVEVVKKTRNKEYARVLKEYAVMRGSKDNIAVIVIMF